MKEEQIMNAIEREAIILNTALKIIDSMVNWSIFVAENRINPTNLLFVDSECEKKFIILLRDFLSQVSITGKKSNPIDYKQVQHNSSDSHQHQSFLYQLRQVCQNPQFGKDVSHLNDTVESFKGWLEKEFILPEFQIPEKNRVVNMKITRYQYITICGDIAECHDERMSVVAKQIQKILKNSNCDIDENLANSVIWDFYHRFFDDILIYHSFQIAEFLNNIRWEVYDYLQPEFKRSLQLAVDATQESPNYIYKIPEEIKKRAIARKMYLELIQRLHKLPLMVRFEVPEILKLRY